MKQYFRISIVVMMTMNSFGMHAQQWFQAPYLQTRQEGDSYNFYEIRAAFHKYEAEQIEKNKLMMTDEAIGKGEDAGKVPGSNQFHRWEWFNEQRVFPSGQFPSAGQILSEYEKFAPFRDASRGRSNSPNSISTITANWINLGAAQVPGGSSAGTGRVNCMAFMPGNSATIFIGTACGGVWKSTNSGASWSVLNTDLLPSLSIASIAIDPINTNNIYIATGDNFAGLPNYFKTLQGHFSAGVYKSTDGGLSWNVTGMSYTQAQLMYIQQIIIDPVTPSKLLLISNTGIFRSTDSAATWTNVKPGNFYSIEFNPLNQNVVYATNGLGLWRSNNNGLTWVYKGGGYPNTTAARVTLGVTPADTNYIYLWGPSAGFKKSVNGGNSFTTMSSPDALTNPYGYYDRAVAVSNTNALGVHTGGSGSAKTGNGGLSWALGSDYSNYLNANYIHQDVKRMKYAPGSGSTLYALTDGGIFVTQDDGTNWTNISHGLQIAEIYRVANNPFNADTIYYGTQDCASMRWDGSSSTVAQVFGSDGMQPLVDYTNPQNVFVCAPYGNLQKSTDGGNTFALASPGQCMWIAPYAMNPLNPQTMYIGAKLAVKKSLTGGVFLSWNNISTGWIDSVVALAVTKADTNYIYAAKLRAIVRSSDAGLTWDTITGTLPVNINMLTSTGITYIAVSSTDPQRVYVTMSGYASGNKVFMSTNGGNTWINYSGSLPNAPVNCITYVDGSNDGVYIGTDFGVFYRDGASSDWTSYNTGLPNVIVNHLDIYYATMKLRAGTYGRGLWESDLPMPVSSFTASATSVCEGSTIAFTDQSSVDPSTWNWSFPGGSPASSAQQNPSVIFSTPGTYTITLTVSNVNGTHTSSAVITVNALPAVPTISANMNILASGSATGNQWYLNSVIIPGETNQNYTVTQNGLYTVVVTDSNGCSSTSAAYNFLSTGIENIPGEEGFALAPNPTDGKFSIITSGTPAGTVKIFNAFGQLVYQSGDLKKEINLTSFAKGLYSVEVSSEDRIWKKKIVLR